MNKKQSYIYCLIILIAIVAVSIWSADVELPRRGGGSSVSNAIANTDGFGTNTSFYGWTYFNGLTTNNAGAQFNSFINVSSWVLFNNFVTNGGPTYFIDTATFGDTVTFNGTVLANNIIYFNDQYIRPAAKNVTGTIDVTSTNYYTFQTPGTNFTLLFSGIPVHGQLISLVVSNSSSTVDSIMTNLAGIYRPSVSSNVTLFLCPSNSISTFNFRYRTNFVAAGQWYVENESGPDLALAAGSNVAFATNNLVLTISASGISSTRFQTNTITIGTQTNFNLIFTNDIAILATNNPTTGSADYFVYIPNAGITSTKLAAMTSAQFGGIISDENGSIGQVIFSGSPTITNLTIIQDVASALTGLTIKPSVTNPATNAFSVFVTASSSTAFVVASNGNVGIGINVPTSALHVNGAANIGSTVTTSGIILTNNVQYNTADIFPSGNATNFQADYTFGWRTLAMTNAVRVTGVVNVASANLGKPYFLSIRNTNGATYRLSVDAGFRRSGSNDVAVANNQNATIIITPDGTGGLNPTNHLATITLHDSP